jgi:hypothetical protein
VRKGLERPGNFGPAAKGIGLGKPAGNRVRQPPRKPGHSGFFPMAGLGEATFLVGVMRISASRRSEWAKFPWKHAGSGIAPPTAAREKPSGRLLPSKTGRIHARWTPIRPGFARTRPQWRRISECFFAPNREESSRAPEPGVSLGGAGLTWWRQFVSPPRSFGAKGGGRADVAKRTLYAESRMRSSLEENVPKIFRAQPGSASQSRTSGNAGSCI